MQPRYSIGQKVRCVSDGSLNIKQGTILTIKHIFTGIGTIYIFYESVYALYEHEIEPLTRTIKEVRIGEIVTLGNSNETKIIDVGKKGLVDENGKYRTFEFAEEWCWKIKQPEPESEIEIAEELGLGVFTRVDEIIKNRKLIIELQKAVNKLVKEL